MKLEREVVSGLLGFLAFLDSSSSSWHSSRPTPLDSAVSSIPTAPAVSPDAPDFEKSLAELEQIVERLERGELSLDESLQQFERGVQLTKSCQTALKQAEHKVELLLRKTSNSGDRATAPFDMDDDASR